MYLFYNILLFLLLPIFPFILIYKEIRGKRYLNSFFIRMGSGLKEKNDSQKPSILIHGVSVGEIITLEPIVKMISRDDKYQIYISSITETGFLMAQKKYLKYGAKIVFFPFDFPFSVKRFLKEVSPEKIVIAETELWPNFLRIAKKMGIKIFIINGRLSEKSFSKYKFFKHFFKKVLKNVDAVFAKSNEDARKFKEIGCNEKKIFIMGNLKFDIPMDERLNEKLLKEMKSKLTPGKILIYGSVMEGEEEILLKLFKKLREKERISLIFAPRHIERTGYIEDLIRKMNLSYFKRSDIKKSSTKREIMILDTLGELKQIYSIGDIVVIGGSILPHGGHNPLEPIIWGKPVITGPHMENFREIVEILKEAGGISITEGTTQLEENILKLIRNEEMAREIGKKGFLTLKKNRGWSEKIYKWIVKS